MPRAARLAGTGRKGRRRGTLKKGFSIQEAYSAAWGHFKADQDFLKYGVILLFLVLFEAGLEIALCHGSTDWDNAYQILYWICRGVAWFYSYQLMLLSLQTVRGKKSRWKRPVTGLRGFGRWIFGCYLPSLVVLPGLLLFIVPGVIAAVGLGYAANAALEYRDKWKILKISWKLFAFLIVSVGVSFLGVLCLLVGMVVTVPLVCLADVEVYRQLERQTDLRAVLKAA